MSDTPQISTKVKLRASRKAEQKQLARSAFGAFRLGEPKSWERYFAVHPHRRPGDTRVATVGSKIAGHATALRLKMSLCGVDVPMAGIAAVAVLPEYRREGVADALMRETLRYIQGRKVALSMLYAFRESYYRKFGYGDVEASDVIQAAPSQLPASRERRNVRRATARDRAEIKALYERQRAGTTGQFLRTDWWWKVRVLGRSPEQLVYRDPRSKKVRGYLLYDVPEQPTFPDQLCRVVELRAETGAAYRGLLGTLEALGDQFETIAMVLPPGETLFCLNHRGVVGQPPEIGPMGPAGFIGGGGMLRIVLLAEALAQHPAPAKNGTRGTIGLDLEDPVFETHSGPFDLSFGPEGARVRRGKRARRRLTLSIDRLAQIYAGTVPARRLLATGFIEGSAEAAELLDHAFAGPALHLGSGNAF